jgi:hypothetical protein
MTAPAAPPAAEDEELIIPGVSPKPAASASPVPPVPPPANGGSVLLAQTPAVKPSAKPEADPLELVPLESAPNPGARPSAETPEMAPAATAPRQATLTSAMVSKATNGYRATSLPAVSASAPPPVPAPEIEPASDALPPSIDALDASGAAVAAPKPEVTAERRKRQISTVLVRETAQLCALLENAVLSCKQQTKQATLKVDRVYVTGGGSRLKGLTEFMSRRLRIEVAPLEPFRQLSLDAVPPQQAEELKAQQHTMAVAVGLALGELQQGAFSFLLWPQALKDSKVFWARGAYLFYAAAFVLMALGLGLYTPLRNKDELGVNAQRADEAVRQAQTQKRQLDTLYGVNEEKRQQFKQITDNTQSGQFFLNMLAEFKNDKRITPDIFLTQIATAMPNAVRVANEKSDGAPPLTAADNKSPADKGTEPDTFQAQRRVYIRGVVRSDRIEKLGETGLSTPETEALTRARAAQAKELVQKILAFISKLVPFPTEPDNPANLFKDIRPIWVSREHEEGNYILREFVLEAYTEGQRPEPAKPKGAKNPKTRGAEDTETSKQPIAGAKAPAKAPAVPPKQAPAAQPKPAPAVPPKPAPAAPPKPAPVAPPAAAQPRAAPPPAVPVAPADVPKPPPKYVVPTAPPVKAKN